MDSEPVPNNGLTCNGKPRTYGLRLSTLDACVLVVAIVATICSWSLTAGWSALLLFVVLHFFLFCNVFRIRRKPELIWAATFLVNCYLWVYLGSASVAGIALSQVVVTILILTYEIRLPYYHGILARAINPRLDDYLAGRV